jgi:membrane protease subunit (stomatin/prohibitin family)
MPAGMKRAPDFAEGISAVLRSESAGEQSRFIRPWRLNADDAGQETRELASCAECGCGISPDLK